MIVCLFGVVVWVGFLWVLVVVVGLVAVWFGVRLSGGCLLV